MSNKHQNEPHIHITHQHCDKTSEKLSIFNLFDDNDDESQIQSQLLQINVLIDVWPVCWTREKEVNNFLIYIFFLSRLFTYPFFIDFKLLTGLRGEHFLVSKWSWNKKSWIDINKYFPNLTFRTSLGHNRKLTSSIFIHTTKMFFFKWLFNRFEIVRKRSPNSQTKVEAFLRQNQAREYRDVKCFNLPGLLVLIIHRMCFFLILKGQLVFIILFESMINTSLLSRQDELIFRSNNIINLVNNLFFQYYVGVLVVK